MVMGCSRRALVDYYREVARTDFREELKAGNGAGHDHPGDARRLCARRRCAAGGPPRSCQQAEYLCYEGVAHGPMVTHVERLAGDIAARATIHSAAGAAADGRRTRRPADVRRRPPARTSRWDPDIVGYIQSIDATLRPFGGRFRVHGGEAEVLEGDWSGDLVMIEFPDRRSARAWYASPAYQAILPLRLENAAGEVILIDAVLPGHKSVDVLAR